jgi:hypothetical protein
MFYGWRIGPRLRPVKRIYTERRTDELLCEMPNQEPAGVLSATVDDPPRPPWVASCVASVARSRGGCQGTKSPRRGRLA